MRHHRHRLNSQGAQSFQICFDTRSPRAISARCPDAETPVVNRAGRHRAERAMSAPMTDRRCGAHRRRSAASSTSDTADPDRAIVRPHLSVPADDHPYVLATRLDPPHPTNAQCRPQPTSLRPDHRLTPARASANARHETAGPDPLVRRSSAAIYRKSADFRPLGCDLEPTEITEIRT